MYFGSYWSCRTRPNYCGGICKNATITCHFGFLFEENLVREFTWLWRHRCRKVPVSKCFPSTRKRKAVLFKFLRFEERFRKAPFSWRISCVLKFLLCNVDATSVTCVVFVLFWMQAVAKFTFFHSKMSCIEFNRKTLNLSWSLCYSFGHLRMEVTRAKLHSLQVMSNCIPSLLIHFNVLFQSAASNWGQNIRLSEWVVISY